MTDMTDCVSLKALPIEGTDKASICALVGGQVYEHPKYADIPCDVADSILKKLEKDDVPTIETLDETWVPLV